MSFVEKLITFFGNVPATAYSFMTVLLGDDRDDLVATRAVVIEEVFPRLAFPLVIALGVSWFSGFGENVHINLFIALAQVLAILGLAGFVELLPAVSSQIRVDRNDESADSDDEYWPARALVQIKVALLVGYLLLGEAAAMWALASNSSNTFLLILGCMCGLLLVREIASTHLHRYGSLAARFEHALARRVDFEDWGR
jgi:uncharacterized membrane protein